LSTCTIHVEYVILQPTLLQQCTPRQYNHTKH